MLKQRRYRFRVIRQPCSQAAADQLNESDRTWADGREYWAGREWLSAGESDEGGVILTGQVAVFRFRGANPVTEQDRIKVKSTGEVYRVTGVSFRREENETTATAERWRGD